MLIGGKQLRQVIAFVFISAVICLSLSGCGSQTTGGRAASARQTPTNIERLWATQTVIARELQTAQAGETPTPTGIERLWATQTVQAGGTPTPTGIERLWATQTAQAGDSPTPTGIERVWATQTAQAGEPPEAPTSVVGSYPTPTPTTENNEVPSPTQPYASTTPIPSPTSIPMPIPTDTPNTAQPLQWQSESTGTSDTLKIQCFSETSCLAIGTTDMYGANKPILISTSDGGVTWSPLPVPAAPLSDVSCPGTDICIGHSTAGYFVGTTDGGQTWTKLSSGFQGYFEAMTCPSTSVCYALMGESAYITRDGGKTWQEHGGNLSTDLQAIACPSITVCYAVGENGHINSTADGGATWKVGPSLIAETLRDISCPDVSTCYAVGGVSSKVIIKTDDGGVTWRVLPSVPNPGWGQTLNGVACVDTMTCYVTGDSATVGSTTDGGNTWNTEALPSVFDISMVDPGYFGVACPSMNVCYVTGQRGVVLKGSSSE